MTEETDAIHALLAEQENAWRSGDAAAFSRAATPEIVFTNVVGLFSVGRAGFEAQHRHIFSTFYKGSILRQVVEQITFVRPDVVIANTLTEVIGFGALPPAIRPYDGVLKTRLEQVMVCTEGSWKVAAFHNVIVHPQASAVVPAASSGTA
ncbi:SgcJ/EcaC family oxidoreductase [Sphingomonas asaccharolytica]|uniref:SgcJ/EcaC family oxidoreductase n=1 Tax=Sphingomonas asaccharolytica TaxID=40681 RepID=UPI00082F0518|nr:SgcJ/EcaC family oxidoreductase [Sphingomonas asaccharolytica]